MAYGDRLIASEDDHLRIYDSKGNVMVEKKGYTFKQTAPLRWILLPARRYLFRNGPLEDTSVLTWNPTEVTTLLSSPEFANDGFVVMGDNGVLGCYLLEGFHEALDEGLVKLSDDGKVMLILTGRYCLYRAVLPGEES